MKPEMSWTGAEGARGEVYIPSESGVEVA